MEKVPQLKPYQSIHQNLVVKVASRKSMTKPNLQVGYQANPWLSQQNQYLKEESMAQVQQLKPYQSIHQNLAVKVAFQKSTPNQTLQVGYQANPWLSQQNQHLRVASMVKEQQLKPCQSIHQNLAVKVAYQKFMINQTLQAVYQANPWLSRINQYLKVALMVRVPQLNPCQSIHQNLVVKVAYQKFMTNPNLQVELMVNHLLSRLNQYLRVVLMAKV